MSSALGDYIENAVGVGDRDRRIRANTLTMRSIRFDRSDDAEGRHGSAVYQEVQKVEIQFVSSRPTIR